MNIRFDKGKQVQASGGKKVLSQVEKHLRSGEFSKVLDELGIKPSQIKECIENKGLKGETHLKEASAMVISQPDLEVMHSALGLSGVETVISVELASSDELQKMRKRLDKLGRPPIDFELLGPLRDEFGVDLTSDTMLFSDQEGGVLLVQAAMDQVKRSLDEDPL